MRHKKQKNQIKINNFKVKTNFKKVFLRKTKYKCNIVMNTIQLESIIMSYIFFFGTYILETIFIGHFLFGTVFICKTILLERIL